MAAVQFLYQWELNKPEQLLDALRVFIDFSRPRKRLLPICRILIHDD